MILHQQLPHPDATLDPWLALHCESLTLALCEPVQVNGIEITPISPIRPISPIGPITNAASISIDLALIAQDIQIHIPGVSTQIFPPSTDPRLPDPEPYLLLNSLTGTTPAILHTQDPVALYLADESGTLAPAAFFRTSTDISAEGWAYWWEDAQRAFHKLTIEFMHATGLPVPAAIADAVKHD